VSFGYARERFPDVRYYSRASLLLQSYGNPGAALNGLTLLEVKQGSSVNTG